VTKAIITIGIYLFGQKRQEQRSVLESAMSSCRIHFPGFPISSKAPKLRHNRQAMYV